MKSLQAVAALMITVVGAAPGAADSGFYASVEALLLAPKVNSQGFEFLFYEGVDFDAVEVEGDFEDGLHGAVRFEVGKEGYDGFGARVRYFNFDQSVAYDGLWDGGSGTIAVIGDVSLDVQAIDFELTQRGDFRSWDILLSGGLRYGSVEYQQPPNFFNGIGAVINPNLTGSEFEGVGPTLSLAGNRPLGYGLSLIGRARVSLLFGDIDYTPAFLSSAFTIEDEFVQVTELQFGLGYDRRLNCGANLNLGVFWEAQRWDSDSNFLGDLSLHGLSLLAGLGF